MKTLLAAAVCSVIGLTAAHFGWQLTVGTADLIEAAERSFFGFITIVVLSILIAPEIRRLESNQRPKPEVSPAAESGLISR